VRSDPTAAPADRVQDLGEGLRVDLDADVAGVEGVPGPHPAPASSGLLPGSFPANGAFAH